MAKSSKVTQLDFFQPTADEINAKRIEEVAASSDRVRKGIYAKHGELLKMMTELKADFDFIKRSICRGLNDSDDSL